MIRRTGIGGFVGNSLRYIKGFFQPSYSVTSVSVDAPDSTYGLRSTINGTLGLYSKITVTQGVSGVIEGTQGVSSAITSTKGVRSTI